jgi:predicted RNase H-like HicB family nuclease/DNA-binding XRE family transcriptional regulator
MRFAGHVFRSGRYWAIEVPILSVVSQGRSKKDAYEMIADAIESLVNKKGFNIEVFPGKGDYFEIGASDEAALTALLLRQERARAGLSLAEVAKRLGAKSINAYARYEQGRSLPTIRRLTKLFSAVAPSKDFVLVESAASV